ncbi:hypothetical protein [Vibrio phage phiKT1019]|nr:hypothetical protein [Vibrio phage phiKT1019]
MSAIINHSLASAKVGRGEPIKVHGKFDGLAQPHLVALSIDGKPAGDVYTDQQGYFSAELDSKDLTVGNHKVTWFLEERTEAATEHTGEIKVRVTK